MLKVHPKDTDWDCLNTCSWHAMKKGLSRWVSSRKDTPGTHQGKRRLPQAFDYEMCRIIFPIILNQRVGGGVQHFQKVRRKVDIDPTEKERAMTSVGSSFSHFGTMLWLYLLHA